MAKQYIDQDYLELVGQRIIQIRQDKKLSQEKFAELVDIDTRQLGRIERAEHNSSISLVKKIADALNISVGSILDL
ncbi:helix-turn-helix domain-containing protein [Pararcticibacter amylolyticus]|uniref:XRE family transcriptional regulator n=1 Tax=Pararcticibacter amylolyticus TaxID=2173175 RepID=A0A2U2P9T1_9SPHI|nr:helix-turn-helix transcriptional regulator [Pararcticibacter amylolyticus]PWG78105.1 XRE family transcriptional regulator [Pararcticibacter amylolyticus]